MDGSTGRSSTESSAARILAAILLASVVIVPWIFTISLADSFYLPKLVALWVILGASVILIGLDRFRILRRLHLGRVDAFVGFFVLWNLIAFARSIDHQQSLYGEQLQHQGLLTTLLYVAFFYLARVTFISTRRVWLAFVALAVSATGVAAYATLQRSGLDPIWGPLTDSRAFSTLGQPDALAAFLVLAITAALTLGLIADSRMRLLWLALTGFMVVGLLFSRSRGGYLGVAVVLVILAVPLSMATRFSRRVVIGVAAAAAFVAAGAVLASVLLPAARSFERAQLRRGTSVLRLNSDLSSRMHLDTWYIGLHVALDHPLLGSGQETYPLLFPRYRDALLPTNRARVFYPYRVESPHNTPLAIADGAGFPALGAYLAVILSGAAALWRVRSRTSTADGVLALGLIAALMGHFVTDSFMSAEVTSSWLFWLLLGMGVAIAQASCQGRPRPDRRVRAPARTRS